MKRDKQTQWESANTVKHTGARSRGRASKGRGYAPSNQHPITQHTACIPYTHCYSPPENTYSHPHMPWAEYTLPALLHATTEMLPSLYNAVRAWFRCRNKTSEFCFKCSVLGGSKTTLLQQFCGLSPATGLKTSSTTHNPESREVQESEEFFHVLLNPEACFLFFLPLRRILSLYFHE